VDLNVGLMALLTIGLVLSLVPMRKLNIAHEGLK
jgi:hypothetical protein